MSSARPVGCARRRLAILAPGDIEQQLRHAGKGYVLGVSNAHVFRSWGKRPSVAGTAADIARPRRPSDWKRLSAGAETKGPRLHDWCYLELADLEAEQFNSANDGLWTRGLLIRRRIADYDLAFSTTWCPAGTSIETLVAVEGHRRAIEDSFETAKTNSGSITTRAYPGMTGIATLPW
jgi:SRSO17 transposase